MIIRHCFTLLLLLSFLAGGYCQNTAVLHLTTKDGLPSNNVYSLYTDAKGYLWMATDKGLCRFNGSTFETFTISDGLLDNEVFNIMEDLQGRYWISTFKGDLCFYKDGKFHTQYNTPWLRLPLQYTSFINRMHIDTDGSLWTSSMDANYFVNIKDNKVRLINVSNAIKDMESKPATLYIHKVNNNRINIYYSRVMLTIDSNGNAISKSGYKGGAVYGGGNNAASSYIHSDKGIYVHAYKKHTFISAAKFPRAGTGLRDTMAALIFVKDSMVIFAGNNYDLSGNKDSIFNNVYVTFAEEDRAGNLWVSTLEKGVFCFSKDAAYITNIPKAYTSKAYTAKFTNGALYFVTSDGGYYTCKDNISQRLTTLETGVHKPSISNFFIFENGGLMQIFESYNILYQPDSHGKVTKRNLPLPYFNVFFPTKEIMQGHNKIYLSTISNILATSSDKAVTNQPEWKGLIRVPNKANDNDSRIYARALHPDDTSVWISRAEGIFRVSETSIQQQLQFPSLIFRKLAFQGGYLLGLTENNKLFISGKFSDKLEADTLADPNCIWENIYAVDHNHVLISTNNNYRMLTLRAPLANGKPNYSIQIVENAFIPLQAENVVTDLTNLYFFKEGTITKVASHVLLQKTIPPAPLFVAFKTRTRSLLVKPLLHIAYTESKNISIQFDNTSFGSKEISSQYSISEDATDDWRDITGNEINLNTPGYGTFTVKVRSRTLSSGFSRPAVLIIHVAKPFWATWWFITLCAFAFLALTWLTIVALTWRRLRKKQKEHDADMKYQQSEYKALNALMNPHFIFNSLNNIQGLINKDEKRTANQYLVIFSDLIRQNMHNISKGFISLQEELTLIENYLTLEKLRFKDMIHYEFRVEEDVDLDDIMIPPLMIQPLVENAVRHGLLPKQSSQSRVIIQVYEKEDFLYIVIEDNGIGLTQSLKGQNKLHESFGLSNLKKRTEHLKKIQQHELTIDVFEVKNEDGTVAGTRAVVKMQLQ